MGHHVWRTCWKTTIKRLNCTCVLRGFEVKIYCLFWHRHTFPEDLSDHLTLVLFAYFILNSNSSLIPNWITFVFPLKIPHTIPHNENVKKSCFKIRNSGISHTLVFTFFATKLKLGCILFPLIIFEMLRYNFEQEAAWNGSVLLSFGQTTSNYDSKIRCQTWRQVHCQIPQMLLSNLQLPSPELLTCSVEQYLCVKMKSSDYPGWSVGLPHATFQQDPAKKHTPRRLHR